MLKNKMRKSAVGLLAGASALGLLAVGAAGAQADEPAAQAAVTHYTVNENLPTIPYVPEDWTDDVTPSLDVFHDKDTLNVKAGNFYAKGQANIALCAEDAFQPTECDEASAVEYELPEGVTSVDETLELHKTFTAWNPHDPSNSSGRTVDCSTEACKIYITGHTLDLPVTLVRIAEIDAAFE